MAFLDAAGISKSFTSASGVVRHVLRQVSLRVEEGEFISIVGAMGSGKSTLLSILAGLAQPDAGHVTIGGERLTGVRQDAAYVFQNYSLLPWFSALENVRLAVEAACPTLTRDLQKQRAREALEQVGLANAIERRPSQLSGGMRQRVAIARAFATTPRVLFMDEPFGALDALTRETLQQDLVKLCSPRPGSGQAPRPGSGQPFEPVASARDSETGVGRPVTTVMITNSVEEAILLSDRIIPMLPGPPATLGAPIPVLLPRPRSVARMAHDEDAMHVRAHVVATLTAALGGRLRRSATTAPAAAPAVSLPTEQPS